MKCDSHAIETMRLSFNIIEFYNGLAEQRTVDNEQFAGDMNHDKPFRCTKLK